MSVFVYNNVTLPYAYSTQFRQEAMYDDLSGTDWFVTKFDITLQAVINSNYLPMLAPDLVGLTTNPADILKIVRQRLLQPRKNLSYQFAGIELIPQPQGGNNGTVDAQNGPKPQSCIIRQLTNNQFLIVYHIIAQYWEDYGQGKGAVGAKPPNPPNNAGSNVLYNRWSESVDINQLQFSTRVRSGKFVIRSDNTDNLIADQIRRQMAITGVPQGFLRTSSRYTVDPSGLAITYEIRDEEQYKLPPLPALQAEGDYTESTTKWGQIRWGAVRLVLRGGNRSNTVPIINPFGGPLGSFNLGDDQSQMLSLAIAIASQKLIFAGADPSRSTFFAFLAECSARIDLYKNEVEVRLKARIRPESNGRLYGVWGFFEDVKTGQVRADICDTPGSDDSTPTPVYLDRGSANLLMQAAAYYDPNLVNNQLNRATDQMNNGLVVGEAGANAES